MEIPIDSVIGGYRLEQRLGEGGMGAVFRARHRTLPMDVALKVLWPSFVRIPQFRERFDQEADLLSRLQHPNVVGVLDKGQDGDLLFIAMQFVDGVDLHTALHQRGEFGPAEAVEIAAAVGRALDHAHERGLLHRDVKPANILLRHGGGPQDAMLTDFGIAKDVAGAPPLTQVGQAIGTFAYASPEQVAGGAVDRRTDVYSLGAVLFELLSGRRAFPQEDQLQLMAAVALGPVPDVRTERADVPRALAAVVSRALAKEPADRFATCADLVAAARTALHARPPAPATVVGAGPEPPPPPLSPPPATAGVPTRPRTLPEASPRPARRRGPLLVAALLAVVVAAIVVGVVLSAGTGGGTDGTTGDAIGPSVSSTTSAGSSATALAVGACLDAANAPSACDAGHAAEVYSTGDCGPAPLVGYLGGRADVDVLRTDLALGQVGAACTVAVPAATVDRSNAGVLDASVGDVWRRCRDADGNELPCSLPHTAEYVYVQGNSTDPLNCTGRASEYLGTPFDRHSDKLEVAPEGDACVITVRGRNVLTASVRNLGSNALPIEAA